MAQRMKIFVVNLEECNDVKSNVWGVHVVDGGLCKPKVFVWKRE